MRKPVTPARSSAGFSLLELLIAMVIMVIVLGMASVFFAQQTALQRAVQSRNDVQDRIRMATQLVTQDLSLAGAAVRIAPDGTIDREAGVADCGPKAAVRCLDLDFDPEIGLATASTLSVRYLSSQFPTGEACRDIAYRIVGGTLQRRDVTCGTGGTAGFADLASDMLGFKVVVVCSTGSRVDTFGADSCPDGYGRSAIVSVGGVSTIPHSGGSHDVTFVTTTKVGSTFAFAPVACPAGRVCYGMTQEVLMPNLKDQ
jgi:prepilin-type N-terminal cleavage/methylation domain-containing protein